MANVKISDLAEDTTPASGDLIETEDVSASASKKVTIANLFANPPIGAISYENTTITNPYKFRVRLGSNKTIANGAIALFDTADYDTNGDVDIVTNKGRFTAPIDGFYYFSSILALLASSNNGTSFGARFKKNGTLIGVESVHVNMYTGSYTLGVSVVDALQLTAGDYIEVVGIGPTSTTIASGSHFEGFLISQV